MKAENEKTKARKKAMKIYSEKHLVDFDFWSGAKSTVELLTLDELEQFESILEDINPDGMSETEVNDFFWFDTDYIAEVLGYSDFETMYTERTRGTDDV